MSADILGTSCDQCRFTVQSYMTILGRLYTVHYSNNSIHYSVVHDYTRETLYCTYSNNNIHYSVVHDYTRETLYCTYSNNSIHYSVVHDYTRETLYYTYSNNNIHYSVVPSNDALSSNTT